MSEVAKNLNTLRDFIHRGNVQAGWWTDIVTGERLERNKAEMIALMHSELSEGLEGLRKNLMDDKLPQYPMITVELADTVVRIMDFCGGFNLDIGNALVDKLAYNATREDHKITNRLKENGKKI